jgi:hypothetical protein
MRLGAVGVLVGSIAAVVACTPPLNPAGEPLKATSTGEAFEGVQCSAVRPQTEPDLMAWDPGSRANLNRLRHQGVVAVRYQAKGCNVELELLSNCIGTAGKYAFSPYSANEKKVAHNASELFAELPVGAARLSGKVKGNRALRTDYMLAGEYALPPDATFKRADLHGTDCARAPHVVSAVHVGAFAMAAGEQRAMDGRASVFGLGAGGASQSDVEVLGDEGDAEACKASQKEHKESEGCGVPFRVGLAPLDAHAALAAAPVPATPAQAAPTAAASGSLLCGRFQLLDAGNGIKSSGTGLVRDTRTGLTWARFPSEGGKDQAAASAYCARKQMRLPTKGEAESIRGDNLCREAWPEELGWMWTSSPAGAFQAWMVSVASVAQDVRYSNFLNVALCVQ